jgi:hypothetical protein
MKRHIILIVCVLVFSLAGINSSSASTDPALIVADVIVVRPACLVATIIGSVFFVVALPVAATSGSVQRAADALVIGPANATFKRPLGDIDSLVDF